MNFISDGGPLFMVSLLILLVIITVLFIVGLKNNIEKTQKLINALALFSFVFGVLGFVIGMMRALNDIVLWEGDIATPVLADGLKIGLFAPTLGMVIFLIGKLFSIILTFLKK